MGTIYFLHFDQPYHHARHYLGYTDDLPARLERHLAANGGRLVRVIRDAGIGFEVARTWEGGRDLERKLKNRHNAPKLCPICRRTGKNLQAEAERATVLLQIVSVPLP